MKKSKNIKSKNINKNKNVINIKIGDTGKKRKYKRMAPAKPPAATYGYGSVPPIIIQQPNTQQQQQPIFVEKTEKPLSNNNPVPVPIKEDAPQTPLPAPTEPQFMDDNLSTAETVSVKSQNENEMYVITPKKIPFIDLTPDAVRFQRNEPLHQPFFPVINETPVSIKNEMPPDLDHSGVMIKKSDNALRNRLKDMGIIHPDDNTKYKRKTLEKMLATYKNQNL